jgi:hypothetical protein
MNINGTPYTAPILTAADVPRFGFVAQVDSTTIAFDVPMVCTWRKVDPKNPNVVLISPGKHMIAQGTWSLHAPITLTASTPLLCLPEEVVVIPVNRIAGCADLRKTMRLDPALTPPLTLEELRRRCKDPGDPIRGPFCQIFDTLLGEEPTDRERVELALYVMEPVKHVPVDLKPDWERTYMKSLGD